VPLLANLARVAEARAKRVGRHLGMRTALIAACVGVGGLVAFCLLAAVTVALAERLGLVAAFGIMAALGLIVLLILVILLGVEERRYRQRALAGQRFERQQVYQAAALAAVPRRLPSRPVAGLLLVAAGALLILARGRGQGPRGDGD
jgi:hypothetical protein